VNTINYPIELSDEDGFVIDASAKVRISFDYTPFERATDVCPGSPESIDVLSAEVWANGVKLADHPASLTLWEDICRKHIRAEREAAEQDRAEQMVDNY
jgi:hypothetical protein